MPKGKKFTGIWIPAEIYLDQDLSWTEKIIYLEISAFTGAGNKCFFSNEYLAARIGISPSQVSRTISRLRDIKLVSLVSFDGITRILEALPYTNKCVQGIRKKAERVSVKTPIPVRKKAERPIRKKAEYNNTDTNSTVNNTVYSIGQKNEYSFFVGLYFKFYEDTFNTRPVFTATDGAKLKSILKKLEIKNRDTKNQDLAGTWNRERAEVLLKHFFAISITDKFIKDKFTLSILDSQFNVIINLKNKNSNATKPKSTPFDSVSG